MRFVRLLTGSAAAGLLAVPTVSLAQSAETSASTPVPTAPPGNARATSYDSAYFAQYAPRTALDIVRRIPGFSLDLGNTDLRGFSGAAGNVVIDGQRPSSKSETLQTLLARIPASNVTRVDVGPGDLYGADYASKSQVANLVLAHQSGGGGIAGTASASAIRLFTGKIYGNAQGSAQLTHGPSTFTLSGDTGNRPTVERGYDLLTDHATGELIEKRFKENDYNDKNPYVSGAWAYDGGKDKSANLNLRYSPAKFWLTQSNHVVPTGEPERDDALHQRYHTNIFELGGDVTRPLGGGALKLIGLANRRHRTTFDDYLHRNLGGTLVDGGFVQTSDSRLQETIGKLSWAKEGFLGVTFEAGGEVAYNKLDYALELSKILPSGALSPIDLPLDNATVSELRGEVYVSAGRELTKGLRANAALNYEVSRLKVRGDALADRSLKFLKPSLTLDWQPGNDWQTQLIVRRTVAQLDFYDFVSSAELSNDKVNGGNANLLPQQTWETRLSLEHPLLNTGKVRLELGHDQVNQLQDRVLIYDSHGKAFDSPGNLGKGTRNYANLNIDAPLDMLWKGFRASVYGNVQRTRVHDPVSGTNRQWSKYFPNWEWGVDLRRDSGRWAYGLSVNDRARFYDFLTDEITSYFNGGIYGSAFVEYRPNGRSTLSLNAENVFNTTGDKGRHFYDPNRTSPEPVADEFRLRNNHTSLTLTYKMSFGGKGKS